jgi:hypothetical protein
MGPSGPIPMPIDAGSTGSPSATVSTFHSSPLRVASRRRAVGPSAVSPASQKAIQGVPSSSAAMAGRLATSVTACGSASPLVSSV